MQQYHGTVAKRQEMGVYASNWRRSLDSLTTTLGTTRLSAAEQEVRVGRHRSMLQQKLQAAGQQADQELLKEVNHYLNEYGQRHHYDFIFGANEGGTIVYAAPGKDLTGEVLQGLNNEYDQRRAGGR